MRTESQVFASLKPNCCAFSRATLFVQPFLPPPELLLPPPPCPVPPLHTIMPPTHPAVPPMKIAVGSVIPTVGPPAKPSNPAPAPMADPVPVAPVTQFGSRGQLSQSTAGWKICLRLLSYLLRLLHDLESGIHQSWNKLPPGDQGSGGEKRRVIDAIEIVAIAVTGYIVTCRICVAEWIVQPIRRIIPTLSITSDLGLPEGRQDS